MGNVARKLELVEDSLRKLEVIRDENRNLNEYRLGEPANNREVFVILEEKGLFPSDFMPLIDKIIGLRNVIVHGYNPISDETIFGVLKNNLGDVQALLQKLRQVCLP